VFRVAARTKAVTTQGFYPGGHPPFVVREPLNTFFYERKHAENSPLKSYGTIGEQKGRQGDKKPEVIVLSEGVQTQPSSFRPLEPQFRAQVFQPQQHGLLQRGVPGDDGRPFPDGSAAASGAAHGEPGPAHGARHAHDGQHGGSGAGITINPPAYLSNQLIK
jgi:hypothetical protein